MSCKCSISFFLYFSGVSSILLWIIHRPRPLNSFTRSFSIYSSPASTLWSSRASQPYSTTKEKQSTNQERRWVSIWYRTISTYLAPLHMNPNTKVARNRSQNKSLSTQMIKICEDSIHFLRAIMQLKAKIKWEKMSIRNMKSQLSQEIILEDQANKEKTSLLIIFFAGI